MDINLVNFRFKKKTIYLLLSFLLVILPSNLSAAKQLPVETNILWERNFIDVAPADLNNDSIDELVVIKTDSDIEIFNHNLNSVDRSWFFEQATFKPTKSISGGIDAKHLWATYVRADSLFLCDLRGQREMFVAKGIDTAQPKGWDGFPKLVRLCDINADGRPEVIVAVASGFDLKPRGIFVLDWLTGELLWKHLCGPVPNCILTKDIDGDGKTELLYSAVAVGNGNFANGTDDSHTYVFLLNFAGDVRWLKSIGAYSSYVEVAWLNDIETGNLRVFTCEVGVPAGGREHDGIFVLDALTGQTLIRKQYGGFNCGHVVVRNAKGQQLIVIGGSDDTLRVLDDKLNLVCKRAVQGNGSRVISNGNFTGKGQDEIAVQTINDQLQLYDSNLQLLGIFPVGSFFELYPCKVKNKTRLLLRTDRVGQPYWRLMEFKFIPVLNRPVTVGTVIYISLILIAIFGLTLVYSRYRQTRDIRTVIRRLTGQAGVIELNRKGEIVSSNSKAQEIISKLNGTIDKLPTTGPLATIVESAKTMAKELAIATVQETVISISPEQTYLVRCVPVKRGALLTFEDISAVEYLKRVTTWAPVAQKLAHGIKNPLATILGAVEQMDIKCEKEEGVKRYIGLVKEEVLKLKKMSDAFMKFTKLSPPVLQTKNINELIKNVMTRYEPLTLPSPTSGEGLRRGKIKVEYNLADNLPLIPIDEEGIINVLNIIIENGIEAMENGGVLRIKTATMERFEKEAEKIKKYLKIEIADTGVGIQEKYLNKVFDPYFTYNKPFGTGLGLTLAKKIVESHNGFIEITSKENIGTQVNIYLPMK